MGSPSAERWLRERTFHHSSYEAAWLTERRTQTISICVPARECAATVAAVAAPLVALREQGAIDEVLVVDADSADGTAQIAANAGATVVQEAELLPSFGPVAGKGDAMWRALSVLSGELIAFVDADIEGFTERFALGLLGPLVENPEISFVKACYRRPYVVAGVEVADAGGRVNHLLARPALALAYGELAVIRQPLAGEIAARRALLESIPFTTGYGVEIAMLIDAYAAVGLDGIAQVDLGEYRHAHQPLEALSEVAYSVLGVLMARMEREGRLTEFNPRSLRAADGTERGALPIERMPMAQARAGDRSMQVAAGA